MSRRPKEVELADVPLGGTRAQAIQRLQIGVGGVVLMVLLVGLASIIQDRAELTDATAVPQAAATTEPVDAAAQNDPLAEAGVVPELPSNAETVAGQGATPIRPGAN